MHKSSKSNRISKAHKLYILVGITFPLAVSAIVLALAAGAIGFAGVFIVGSAGWSVFALNLARRRKETDKTRSIVEETPRHIRSKRFLKTVSFLILLAAITTLVFVIIYSSYLFLVLATLWWIIVNGSEFVFVSILTDE